MPIFCLLCFPWTGGSCRFTISRFGESTKECCRTLGTLEGQVGTLCAHSDSSSHLHSPSSPSSLAHRARPLTPLHFSYLKWSNCLNTHLPPWGTPCAHGWHTYPLQVKNHSGKSQYLPVLGPLQHFSNTYHLCGSLARGWPSHSHRQPGRRRWPYPRHGTALSHSN